MYQPAPAAFIYIAPRNQLVRVTVTDGLKNLVRARLDQIRQMIREQFLPEPTPVRARCDDGEFRNYCSDIFWTRRGAPWRTEGAINLMRNFANLLRFHANRMLAKKYLDLALYLVENRLPAEFVN